MLAPYFEEHKLLRIDPVARSPQNTRFVSKDEAFWRVEQILCDPEETNDWMIACKVHLDRSREAGHPVLELEKIRDLRD